MSLNMIECSMFDRKYYQNNRFFTLPLSWKGTLLKRIFLAFRAKQDFPGNEGAGSEIKLISESS